jgi:hypothetical protein
MTTKGVYGLILIILLIVEFFNSFNLPGFCHEGSSIKKNLKFQKNKPDKNSEGKFRVRKGGRKGMKEETHVFAEPTVSANFKLFDKNCQKNP